MAMETRDAHIFDLDGTITRRDTFVPFLMGLLLVHPLLVMYIPQLLFNSVLFHLKLIDNQTVKVIFLEKLLANTPIEKASRWAKIYVDRVLAKNLNISIVEHINALKKSGSIVAVASASLDIYVEPLARRLKIDYVICTQLDRDESGCYTGQLKGKNCYGLGKKERVVQWIKNNDGIESTYFYTDHHSDIPLLRYVDNPILVNPTKSLRKLAKLYGFSLHENLPQQTTLPKN